MPGPIGIVSIDDINEEQLIYFVKENGGFYTGDKGLFGRFSKEDSHIWIGLSPVEELEYLEQDKEFFIKKLSGIPKTNVTVEIGDGKDSSMLALNFALLFMNYWPAIVDDLKGHLFLRDDLIKFREIGKNF